ncbi:hypothetical protein NEMBOFW57_004719 [Staphylotrichum longicolle]|uniref:Uncharacterized protein n=1 Tax=Staphylotrichum longicolle TaxID=669026 RepID=A0AAD4F7N1_9PEZI|nr:hypothetical protein NEMBOFW57_004719 [Staphylotrichum longicolle]
MGEWHDTVTHISPQIGIGHAQFVFFSRNRFIIHDFHASQPWDLPAEQLEPDSPETASTSASYPFERLAISEFLREVVPIHCLAYLRFLELVFPPYVPHSWPDREHPAILDWVATVDWVRGQVNAPALTLRLVMADFGAAPITGRKVMTEALAHDIVRGYAGLAGFYLQLAHPMRWTLDALQRAQRDEGFWPDCTETSSSRLSGICGARLEYPRPSPPG